MEPGELIIDQPTLEACCRRWRELGCFAFDTEFIRDETYDAALCLIQVSADGEVVLIDPTADIDVGVFWALVTDPAVTTIVHAGKEDFDVCLRMTGKPPRNVFDVQLAAGLVGYHYPLSLTRLVEQALGQRISKAQTLTDWLRRPLTAEQIRYAIDDVAHLPRIQEHLAERLEKAGRRAWAREEFQRFEDAAYYKPPTQDRVARIKGTKRLDGPGLVALELLIEWRDRWAQEKNRPVRALIRDDVIVEIARRRPREPTELQVLRGFPQSRNPKIINEVLAIIEKARQTPRDQWPAVHEPVEYAPMIRATLDLLSAVMRALCDEHGVSVDLVGSAQRLRELIDHDLGLTRETPALLSGWRGKFIGEPLRDLLRGRSELRFSGWPKEPLIEVVTHERPADRAQP
ncbi:MAG: ribonuclease D [Phycisphaerae bacterium]